MMASSEASPTGAVDVLRIPEGGHRAAMVAGFCGWLLDAFDFFLVTFCLTAIARDFHRSDAQIALVITMTLAFRPVGGFIFGILADRYGRRRPLMINIGFFAVAEILTGLAPNYTALLIVRAFFGVVMGGQWGVGASLVMEKAPAGRRGLLSGLLQEGYAAGNVLAALSFFFLYGRLGWRPLFFLGSLPALLLVWLIRFRVKESEVWERSRRQSWGEHTREVFSHWKLFLYLLAFMTMMLLPPTAPRICIPRFCSVSGITARCDARRLQRSPASAPSLEASWSGIFLIDGVVGGPSSRPLSWVSSLSPCGLSRPTRDCSLQAPF
jgi:SHS family lactate transporter-like MFS transporter